MKNFKKIFFLILFFGCFLANSAHAQQWCTTKVSNLFISGDGSVIPWASSRGDYLKVCNINSSWKNITPTLCASWLGLLRSAVARKSNMLFYYNEPTSCGSIPSYGDAPAPGYIMLMD